MAQAIISVAVVALAGVIVWIKFWSDISQRRMLFEAQKQLIDKLGSGTEVAQFLSSKEGGEFFERLKPTPKPLPPKPSPAEVMFFMIWAGTIVALVGVGFFVGAVFLDKRLILAGALCLTAGTGVLLGLFITHQLAKKWGIFRKPRAASENP